MSRSVLATRDETTETQTSGCPECNGTVRREQSEEVCTDCGLVVDAEKIDHGPEWRNYNDDTIDRRRAGPPLTEAKHDRGLSCKRIDLHDVDMTNLSKRRRYQLNRLKKWDGWTTSGSKPDRNLQEGFGEVKRMATALGLPKDHAEQACRLYRQAQSENLLLGRSIEGVGAAALYAVDRINNGHLSITDVEAVARVGEQAIWTGYRAFNEDLGLPIPPPNPTRRVPKVADELDTPADVTSAAMDLVQAYHETVQGSGRKPDGVAAAALYICHKRADHFVSQECVAKAGDVSIPTVRKRFHELQEVAE